MLRTKGNYILEGHIFLDGDGGPAQERVPVPWREDLVDKVGASVFNERYVIEALSVLAHATGSDRFATAMWRFLAWWLQEHPEAHRLSTDELFALIPREDWEWQWEDDDRHDGTIPATG